jgi:Mn-dependent DtxR family transcriptional regulator
MSDNQGLSRSKAHYLKAVYKLSETEEGTRVTQIADEIGVTKASSSRAITELEKSGFICRTKDHRVLLTSKGEAVVETMAQSYEMIKNFLASKLGLSEKISHEVACELEHILTPDDACAISQSNTPY